MSYHPLFDSTAVALISILSLGFTQASFPQRFTCLLILSFLTWHCVTRCPTYINRSSWASSVGGYTLSSLLHYVDVGVLSGWAYELQGPKRDFIKKPLGHLASHKPVNYTTTTRERNSFSVLPRLKFGLMVFCSWRFVNTPYQVRNVPPLGENLYRNRIAFLIRTGITIAVCYLLLDGMNASQDPQAAEKFFSVEKAGLFSRLHSVTLEEFFMRFFAALGLGVSLVSVQRGMYNILAFICVASGASQPKQWPPFNGSISQIYSLRKFWR